MTRSLTHKRQGPALCQTGEVKVEGDSGEILSLGFSRIFPESRGESG